MFSSTFFLQMLSKPKRPVSSKGNRPFRMDITSG